MSDALATCAVVLAFMGTCFLLYVLWCGFCNLMDWLDGCDEHVGD